MSEKIILKNQDVEISFEHRDILEQWAIYIVVCDKCIMADYGNEEQMKARFEEIKEKVA